MIYSIRTTLATKTTLILGLLVCLSAAPGWAAPPDAWITAKTKLALFTTEGVSASAVNVDTVNGRVTLHGKVESDEEKIKAENVAKSIEGAQGVRNLLQVVAPQREKAVQISDAEIKKHVEKALGARKLSKNSHISVQSVNQGVVLLSGKTQTLTDHLAAVETAACVPGVRRVSTEIESPTALVDAEIWHEKKVANQEHGISDTARDAWVTSATKMRLLADSRTPALDINVDTRNGVVTLFGMVPTTEAKTAAETDARKVSGVERVINELQVVPSAKQETVKARDEVLQGNLEKEFEARTELKDITVDVKNCVARLTGTVPSAAQRLEAAFVARSTQGVCSVEEDLQVRSN